MVTFRANAAPTETAGNAEWKSERALEGNALESEILRNSRVLRATQTPLSFFRNKCVEITQPSMRLVNRPCAEELGILR